MIFGFVTDVLTFRLINFNTAMILLSSHLLFVGINIGVINFYEAKKIAGKFFSYWRVLAPLFLQYSFGNLFSAFLIFYSHSGSFFASWPFIVVIIFLMVGNEIFRTYNIRPTIQISVYFFALFSYLNLLFPNIFNDLGTKMFLGSGFISLFIILFFIVTLSSFIPEVREKKKNIFFSVGVIFFIMNLFYFLNLIPPIPLSIQKVGIYHEIERVNNNYEGITESCGNWFQCSFYHEKRHIRGDRQKLYLFSAVFAPEGMKLNVVHEWQKFNYDKKSWENAGDISFSVVGGREYGYRWYTYNTVSPGFWRVNVKTSDGKTIGRKNFYVLGEENVKRVRRDI